MCVKQPGSPLRIAIKALLLKVWFDIRSWVQKTHGGIREMLMVTAKQVNSDLWVHRHILWRFNNFGNTLL